MVTLGWLRFLSCLSSDERANEGNGHSEPLAAMPVIH